MEGPICAWVGGAMVLSWQRQRLLDAWLYTDIYSHINEEISKLLEFTENVRGLSILMNSSYIQGCLLLYVLGFLMTSLSPQCTFKYYQVRIKGLEYVFVPCELLLHSTSE